jgi:hypothetical protein
MSNIAGKAYGMNVITPMKPWKTWLNVVIFRVGRLLPGTLGGLLGLSLIHFARWVMIRRKQWPDLGQGPQALNNDYMLFCSNFNGTWDQYIDAFSDGIPAGLDMFWYSSTKYPHSIPITPFKDYILHNQIDTNYYYNATPGSAQRDIKSALKLYQSLLTLATLHPQLAPDQFAGRYRAALLNVQGNLPSAGYAPVASIDTWEADWNRAPFIEREQQALGARAAPATAATVPEPAAAAGRASSTSFDGGHYFLTVLAPIQNTHLVEYFGVQRSAVQRLRNVLATLPTALQSLATQATGRSSPFARSTRTHLARFAVIDDVRYNGREPVDALIVAASRNAIRLVSPQPQDRLNCHYLLFAAEFDAKDGSVATVRGYLGELWQAMEAELRAIFENCFGFERVRDAASFCDYIMACELETTTPFNDYWVGSPPLKSRLLPALAPALVVATLCVVLCWVMSAPLWLLGLIVAVYVAYRGILTVGGQPFPTAPNSDLPSVLKALYLQRHFIRHLIETQGDDAVQIHTKFGNFLAAHQPQNPQPSQAPGIIA